jgi:hypothetical protein
MKETKYDRITIRFDWSLGKKIRALAKRRGLTVAEYCRMMCLLEVINDEPDTRLVEQQLKDTLADVEAFARLEVEAQMPVLREAVDAVDKLREASKTATTWLLAVARAVDAYGRQKGERGDVSSERHASGLDTLDEG